MIGKDFSILITTKNRVEDLKTTLKSIYYLIEKYGVHCIICDDGSNDGTYDFVKSEFNRIEIFRHASSKGLIQSRNKLLEKTTTKYAISLDDDAHFLSDNILDEIDLYFRNNQRCGVLTFRIFWGKNRPKSLKTNQKPHKVNGFVGCGHVWRMEAWNNISNYPGWFLFYGEEQFASMQLFKNNWDIMYIPSILVHHRVDMKARVKNEDYLQRQRRSLRSGWYIYFMCYPKRILFRKFASSLWSQLKRKTIKGDIKATRAIVLALIDLLYHIPYYLTNTYRFTHIEYSDYIKLPEVEIYWKP